MDPFKGTPNFPGEPSIKGNLGKAGFGPGLEVSTRPAESGRPDGASTWPLRV